MSSMTKFDHAMTRGIIRLILWCDWRVFLWRYKRKMKRLLGDFSRTDRLHLVNDGTLTVEKMLAAMAALEARGE